MNLRLLELREQRGLLRARCAEQRRALTQYASVLQQTCALADKVKAGRNWIKRHPLLVGGAAALLVFAKPARLRWIWRLARWSQGLWRGWRGLANLLRDKLPF
ncbi:MAG: YqjK-like family protein [Zoogloeaceae bacterium]|nr:YqjK-like family protein [Zoogloeaceae bacterium]